MNDNPFTRWTSEWWRYWGRLPEDIRSFLRRLYDFAPVLWNDRDYDYAFLLVLMRFKLNRIRLQLEAHNHTFDTYKCVAELEKADELLRNIIDGDPKSEWDAHYDAWHVPNSPSYKCGAADGKCKEMLDRSIERDKRNWYLLWEFLDANMQKWWD